MGLYEREREDILDIENALRKRQGECAVADELMEKFPDVFTSAGAGYRVMVYASIGAMSDMAPILRFLARKGLRHKGATAMGDSGVSWLVKNPDSGDIYSGISIVAYFKEDGQCRKVKVGEKLEPIYELRCGNDGASVPDLIKNFNEQEGQ